MASRVWAVRLPGRRPKQAQSRRQAIWLWPTVGGAVSFLIATGLARIDLSGRWADLAWPGDTEAASTLVQVVAASVVTVTTLTFSLTVLALQLASQQFSPRLLREFTRDPVTRWVLSILVATFAMAVAVLRHLRSDSPVPHVAVLAVMAGGLASLAALLGFITHIVRVLRVDTMMATVHQETQAAIKAFYPAYDDHRPRAPGPSSRPPGPGHLVAARRSGFVRMVDVDALVADARADDLMVELIVRPGDHVVVGTPVAVAWARAGGALVDSEAADRAVHGCVELGYERTLEQDSAFGFRQLEDIAVKALSPGVNDPVTAAHAIGYMADLVVQLLGCRLGPTVHEDDQGTARATVPDRDLAYYLDLACGQVRRYGRGEPTVLVALLRMLRDAATASRDDRHRAAITAEVDYIVAAMDESLLDDERQSVTDMAARVRASLDGDLLEAYGDRAGETRSL